MKNHWETRLKQVAKDYEQNKSVFLRTKSISKSMHPNIDQLAQRYWNVIQKDDEFLSAAKSLSKESYGSPLRFSKHPDISPVTVQHLFHIKEMSDKFGFFVPDSEINHVTDVGGGYGNTCRLFFELGFTGKYVIADFPEVNAIQEDFLTHHKIKAYYEDNIKNKGLVPDKESKSLLLGTFSINEMPLSERKHLEEIYREFDYLCIVHNLVFDDIDNVKYFADLKKELSDEYDVQHYKDPHKGQGSYFFIGKRK